MSGSTDKSIRKWHIQTNKDTFEARQVRIGLLCDEFSHLKKKSKMFNLDEDTSEDLGQIRTFKIIKVGKDDLVFCGDSCGYIWIFDAKTLLLISIKELHQDEIMDITAVQCRDTSDPRHNLLITCSRDKEVKSFKYQDEDLVEVNEFSTNKLPVIGLGVIHDEDKVKLVFIDAESNLCIRSILENLEFGKVYDKKLAPRKFYSLAVRDNKIAIGMDTKIQFGELKAKNYWALMKSAGGNQPKMKDFIKLEIDDTNTYVFCSTWKSNDVHCIDLVTTRVMATFSSGEFITCMKVTPDHKHLITCSSRGSFYIWKLPKQVSRSMKFRAKQNELVSTNPSLTPIQLDHIREDEEHSEELSEDIDGDTEEGNAQAVKRKEWTRLAKNKSESCSSNNNQLEKLEEELAQRLNSDFYEDLKNMQQESVDEVDFTPETPKIGSENNDSIKSRFEFQDVVKQGKRRVSCNRRDSKIGRLIRKSSNLKHLDMMFEERKYNSQIENDKFGTGNEVTPHIPAAQSAERVEDNSRQPSEGHLGSIRKSQKSNDSQVGFHVVYK